MSNSNTEAEQFEKIRTKVFPSSETAVRELASIVANVIRQRQSENRRVVLGLATGSTPVKLYQELIRLHREEGLSFQNVVTFNLDEYYGLPPDHPESYRHFMEVQLFRHVDLPPKQTHVPDGLVERDKVFEYCADYESLIEEAGGIDIQIVGIGRTGHIGFNEPGSGPDSRTRMVALDRLTRRDAARDFRGEANVPAYAITMGIGTILQARQVLLLAWGESKAPILRSAIEGPETDAVPASFLQRHPDCGCYVDQAAACELTRFRTPWKVGPVKWDRSLARKAVTWLAGERKKPVLRLGDEDYTENALAPLLVETGSAYGLNIRIFNELQHTITGWPGGKPNADDTNRPVPAEPPFKRVLVFSPEPLDAEIGMAGTLHRLVRQRHEVTLAYLTSGNLSVPDGEARMAFSLLHELGVSQPDSLVRLDSLAQETEKKAPFDEDSPDLRRFKGLIRRAEARASCQILGLNLERVRFLDLSFYEQGRYRQFRWDSDDIKSIAALVCSVQPHQIYLTGAGADPSSVSGIVFQLGSAALRECSNQLWYPNCQIWLYASNERPWPPHEIDMAVPLSPAELAVKLDCLYHHRSQRSQTPFTETQAGEGWQQAEQINRATAQHYDRLGLAEYEAIESFRVHKESAVHTRLR
ncbi:MAG TPA: glucosamine-6-phosphate deaminase [Chthoniobacterales bacterium]|nr:glucosamine-6-phosphate deaminase [Chthoniobacterales bacterium]